MKQFSNEQEKRGYLNKLLSQDSEKLADNAMKLLDFKQINYMAIEHSPEYYQYLVQYYAGIIMFNFGKLNESGLFTNEFMQYELKGFEITHYLNKLKLSAAVKIVDKIYYNSRDMFE